MTSNDWRSNVRQHVASLKAEAIARWMRPLRCAICRRRAEGYQIREGWVSGGGPDGDAFPTNLELCSSCHRWVCHDDYEHSSLASLCRQCWDLEHFVAAKPDSDLKRRFSDFVLTTLRNRGPMPDLDTLWSAWQDGQTALICAQCEVPAARGTQVCPMCGESRYLRPIQA